MQHIYDPVHLITLYRLINRLIHILSVAIINILSCHIFIIHDYKTLCTDMLSVEPIVSILLLLFLYHNNGNVCYNNSNNINNDNDDNNNNNNDNDDNNNNNDKTK